MTKIAIPKNLGKVRVAMGLGGKFTVETAPRAGTTVRVEVPSG